MKKTASDTAPAAIPSVGRGADESRIRAERVALGMTRRALALAAGSSYQTVANVENGHDWPSFELACALAGVLEVADVGSLFDLRECGCGCGRMTTGAPYLPGHRPQVARPSLRTDADTARGRRDDRIIAGYLAARKTGPAIAEEEGISFATVYRVLDERGVPRPRRPLGRSGTERSDDPRRIYPVPDPRPCAYCGELFTPTARTVANGWGGRYCSHRCRARDNCKPMMQTMSARARQKAIGSAMSRRVDGKPRGRRRGYSDEQARAVVDLRQQNGRIGEREIARRLTLSKRQVHEILVAAREVVRKPF
jgi:transcriptional regulator with XRE-family HTH domain